MSPFQQLGPMFGQLGSSFGSPNPLGQYRPMQIGNPYQAMFQQMLMRQGQAYPYTSPYRPNLPFQQTTSLPSQLMQQSNDGPFSGSFFSNLIRNGGMLR